MGSAEAVEKVSSGAHSYAVTYLDVDFGAGGHGVVEEDRGIEF